MRDLPWTVEKLRELPPFEFENWAVVALGGRKNKAQVGDKGIDGRIFPVSSLDNVRKAGTDELALEERFYAMQVKQKDKAGRPDMDAFETAMRRAKCEKGFFVSFDFSSASLWRSSPSPSPRPCARSSTSRSRTSWRERRDLRRRVKRGLFIGGLDADDTRRLRHDACLQRPHRGQSADVHPAEGKQPIARRCASME